MSVIVLKSEIEQIADALYWDAMGQRHYIHTICNPKSGITIRSGLDDIKDVIGAWTNRLYVANQIAYIFTYCHRDDCGKEINQLDRDDWKNGNELIAKPTRFFHILESVKYNLYSNGGQVMLSGDDMQKLDCLTAMVARRIVCDVSKGIQS